MMFSVEAWQDRYARVNRILERPAVARTLKAVQTAVFGGVVIWLVWRLSAIGWREVLEALPTAPWFYVFFALRYMVLPLSEIAIYEQLWGLNLTRHLPIFIRKRVFNAAVAGYSGEAFFTLWARRRLALSDGRIVSAVKNNNILSALASNATTALIIAGLFAAGILQTGVAVLPDGAAVLIGLAFAIALTLSLGILVFRNRLITIPPPTLRTVAGLHSMRIVVIMTLHAAMYAAALPTAPVSTWLLFIAVQLVISRIPLMPNQDIVFLGVALSMAPVAGAPEAAIAGMLLAESALGQVTNLALFLATAYLARGEKPEKTPQGS